MLTNTIVQECNTNMVNQERRHGDVMTWHYADVIMTTIASQITSLTVVYSTVYSDADQRNIKVPRHWPLCGEFTGTGEFPAQRASYAENVSIWWRHHGKCFALIGHLWRGSYDSVPTQRASSVEFWFIYIVILHTLSAWWRFETSGLPCDVTVVRILLKINN